MPTLNWIGKEKVINHHQEVPFRVLNHQYGYTEEGNQETPVDSGNLIIHGDNLEALKALLPQYEAKVKCIYIDPPYNTGNEGWSYNDNVNDPKIRKWLHQVVGKEGEDLSRHDKWLCMMYPRLVLLHRLLAPDGALFVSIDDNEQASLKLILDEIFGASCLLGNICWQKKQSPQNDAINFSDMHDFVVAYAKRKKVNRNDQTGFKRNLIIKTDEQRSRYKNPDNDFRGVWASGDCTSNKTKYERPNLYFGVVAPHTQETVFPSESRVWRFEQSTFKRLIEENRIYWGKTGNSFPRLKLFHSDVADGVVPSTWWTREFAGDNQEGRRTLRTIFGGVDEDFSTPKPTSLIERIIQIAADNNSLIIDSFAGSGTTAHAVLNLNKQDGGNRKFILEEMEDYAETITAERVKRVINGYADVEGTGGSFDYYELGPPLFDESGNLNDQVPLNRIREYIWYSETRSAFNNLTEDQLRNPYFLGIKEDTRYYFYYEPQQVTTLDYDFLGTICIRSEQYVVYADNCLLSKTFLQNNNIIFKKIPRDISRL